MDIGQRIRNKRKMLKLTQGQLAAVVGVTTQHISAVELGRRLPSLDTLVKMAVELGVTVDYVLTGKESIIQDIIPAIKADKSLDIVAKKALITLVKELKGPYIVDDKLGGA